MENYYVFSSPPNIYYYIFIFLTIIYKLVLHAVALVLAFLTRNVKVDILNDYHYNTAIIVALSLLLLAVIFNTLLLRDFLIRSLIAWAFIVFLMNSFNLGLTFVPKVSPILRGLYKVLGCFELCQ